MKKLATLILLIASLAAAQSDAQIAAAPTASAPMLPKKREKQAAKKDEKSSTNQPFGGSNLLQSNEPTTTEIYADEAVFDSNKSMGIFSGRVKVTDPRFNLQSDKLTVFISKGENQGLERAIAEGNVGLVRDRPDPNGGPPTRAIGRSDKAIYTAATGDVELTGTPRVQEGPNMHVATSPDTVMIINQNSQLTTHGPSRTEIRQQPKEETKGETKSSPSPALSPPPLPKP
jgi:lipopolysaccharide transport protein LptA